jgi:hypothetical protein
VGTTSKLIMSKIIQIGNKWFLSFNNPKEIRMKHLESFNRWDYMKGILHITWLDYGPIS